MFTTEAGGAPKVGGGGGVEPAGTNGQSSRVCVSDLKYWALELTGAGGVAGSAAPGRVDERGLTAARLEGGGAGGGGMTRRAMGRGTLGATRTPDRGASEGEAEAGSEASTRACEEGCVAMAGELRLARLMPDHT